MTVQPTEHAALNPKLKGAIRVESVTGGADTNPLWESKVDNDSFKKALEDSLSIAGYLAPGNSDAPYVISAALEKLKQPFIGLTFDVTSTVLYKISGNSIKKEYPVTATGTATMSDAFVGVERLRIANEKSIKENIKALLIQLQNF